MSELRRRKKLDEEDTSQENTQNEEFLPNEKVKQVKFKDVAKKSFQRPDPQRQASILKSFANDQVSKTLIITSRRADAILAAFGMSMSLTILKILENAIKDKIGVTLHGGFLISSGANFFFNRTPPSPKAFLSSSIVSIILGICVNSVQQYLGDYCDAFCIFGMMTYWKLQGNNFGAAGSLSIYIATKQSKGFPFAYVCSPYLLGHVLLYLMANGLSIVRQKIRIILIKREFFHVESSYLRTLDPDMQEKRLRLLFNRMDLSGDGTLDAEELQSALKSAFDEDLSLEEAKEFLVSVDRTGDGVVDFDEFKIVIDDILRR